MKTLCQPATICPCDNLPGTDYDATAPETDEFVATGFAAMVPPLGTPTWQRLNCMMFAESETSQAAAQFNADQQALLCVLNSVSPYSPETGPGGGGSGGGGGGGGGGGLQPLVFFNGPASCTVNCPDGLPFTFQVPAGRFPASSQAAADAAAETYACQQAAQRALCLSALTPSTFVLNTAYNGSITATGGGLAGGSDTNLWQLVSGSLPTGLTFNGGALPSNQVTITGTPTVAGSFTFAVQCTDPQGDTMTKTYTLAQTCAQTVTIAPGSDGFVAYAPPAPYDSGYKYNSGGTGNDTTLFLTFQSATLKTWNWMTAGCGGPLNPGQFGGMVDGVLCGTEGGFTGNWSCTGSFTTDACTPKTIEIRWHHPFGTGPCNVFAWQTP